MKRNGESDGNSPNKKKKTSNEKEKPSEKEKLKNYMKAIEPYMSNNENILPVNRPPDYYHILNIFSTIVPFFVFYKKKNEIRSAVISEIKLKNSSRGKQADTVPKIQVRIGSIHTGNSLVDHLALSSQNIIESPSSLQNCLSMEQSVYNQIKNITDLDNKIRSRSTNYKDLKYISRDGRIINLHVLLYNDFLNLKMYCCSPLLNDGKYYLTIEGLLPLKSEDNDGMKKWMKIVKEIYPSNVTIIEYNDNNKFNINNNHDIVKENNVYLQSSKIEEKHQSSNDNHNVIKENMNGNEQINRTNEYLQSSGINNDLVRSNSNDKHDVVNGYLNTNGINKNIESNGRVDISNSNDNHNVIKENTNGNLQINDEKVHPKISGITNDMTISNSNDNVVKEENMNKIKKNDESSDRVDIFNSNDNNKFVKENMNRNRQTNKINEKPQSSLIKNDIAISNSNDNHNVVKENTNEKNSNKKKSQSYGINKTQFRLQKNESDQRKYEHNESKSIQGEYAEKILLFYLKSKGIYAERPEDSSAPFDIVVSNNNSLSKYDEISIEDDHINLIEVKSKITDRENRFDDFILTGSELKYMLEYNDRYIIYIICFDKSKCPLSLYEYKFDNKDLCDKFKINLESFESTWGVVPRSFDIKFCDKKTKEIKEFKDWLNKDMNEEDRKLFKRIFKRECNESKIIDELKKVLSGYE